MRTYENRQAYLPELCRDQICVEVGVQRGVYARQILEVGQPARLHLVDLWQRQDPDVYVDRGNVTVEEFNAMFQDVQAAFRDHENVQLWRMSSQAACDAFANASLDFVYLDANHRRKYVLQDLRAWWPKLKPGGWLCGHDYKARTKVHKGQRVVLEVGEALAAWLPSIKKRGVDFTTVEDDSYGIQKT